MESSSQMYSEFLSELLNEKKNEKINIYYIQTPQDTNEFLSDYKLFLESDPPPSIAVQLISEKKCLELKKEELSTSIMVFERFNFESVSFLHLYNMKTVYIFSSKLINKFSRKELQITNPENYHQLNGALHDVAVCSASLMQDTKSRFRKLIRLMGGKFSNALMEGTEYLVTSDVFAKKYTFAEENGIKIVLPAWVEEMWNLALLDKPIDMNQLLVKHKLPTFYNLEITSTGISLEEKPKIYKLVQEHGGKYNSVFKTTTTKVLLLRSKDVKSQKFKAAQKHNILCLDPQWIYDSSEAGFAQKIEKYIIEKLDVLKSSTPTKKRPSPAAFNLDNTAISAIYDYSLQNIAMDATNKTLISRASLSRDTKQSTILSARQLTQKTDSHTFKKPLLPSDQKDSSKQVKLSSTERFPINISVRTESSENSDESFIPILLGKVVCVTGFQTDHDSIQCIKECEKLGASLVDLNYEKEIDYMISPSQYILTGEEPKLSFKHLLNDIWLEESVEVGTCIDPPKFYHYPFYKRVHKEQVLKGETFVCSGYIDRERQTVRSLIEILGGDFKESLSKSDKILICQKPAGNKFEGAKNWKMTVIRAEWITECYLKRRRVDETPFLVGGTKASSRNILPLPIEEEIPCSQDAAHDKTVREEKEKVNMDWIMEDIPTPVREMLNQEKRRKEATESPRSRILKDLIITPGTARNVDVVDPSSPAPELPTCLKLPSQDYSLFPNSSPTTQWFYKNKFDALDEDISEMANYRKRMLKEGNYQSPSLYEIRRRFYKKCLPATLISPSPVKYHVAGTQDIFSRNQLNMSNEASKFLNFSNTESHDVEKEFNDLKTFLHDKRENVERSTMKMQKKLIETEENEPIDENERISTFEIESEKVLGVEWKDTQNVNESLKIKIRNTRSSLRSTLKHSHSMIDIPKRVNRSDEEKFFEEISRNHVSESVLQPHLGEQMQEESEWAYLKAGVFNGDDNVETEMACGVDKRKKISELIDLEEEKKGKEENKKGGTDADNQNFISKHFVFGLSSGSSVGSESKLEMQEMIIKLGGEVSEENFNYLIVARPIKSTKYFIALASGKKVLHSDYLKDCMNKKKFISTDEYELGSPKFRCEFIARDRTDIEDIINSPYRCRMLIERNFNKYQYGLFTGKKFKIYGSEQKHKDFEKIIRAGGGTIISEKEFSLKTSLLKHLKIDYCLIDNKSLLSEENLNLIKSCGISCKTSKFIYDFLLAKDKSLCK